MATVTDYNVAQFRLFVARGASPLSRPMPEPVGVPRNRVRPEISTGKKP